MLARSLRRPDGFYVRDYPFGPLFALADRLLRPLQRLDAARALPQRRRSRARRPQQSSLLDQLEDRLTKGDEVVTTLDPHAQQVASPASPAVPARSSRSSRARARSACSSSTPSYDPNAVKSSAGFERLLHDPSAPLFDNATQAQYAPGSTFKVVTTIAAIDTGRLTPDSVINGNSPIIVSGQPLANDGGTSYGRVTLSDALTQLDQHRLRAGRAEGRRRDAPELHAAARLLRQAADRPAERRAQRERRALPGHAAATCR